MARRSNGVAVAIAVMLHHFPLDVRSPWDAAGARAIVRPVVVSNVSSILGRLGGAMKQRLNPRKGTFGLLLRRWRKARGISQLNLALDAGLSARHLSFIETGRAKPSRGMVLRLGEALDLPLRERNELLIGAGFAAVFPASSLHGVPLAQARKALTFMLRQQEPYPALVVNRALDMLMANEAAQRLLALLGLNLPKSASAEPPNLLRALLHPDRLRRHVVNWEAVALSMIASMRRELIAYPDAAIGRLLAEVMEYPGIPREWPTEDSNPAIPPLLPLTLEKDGARMSWFTIIAMFGTPQDITLQDLRLETFFPADEATEAFCRQQARQSSASSAAE
jgi:transcriptional regulator with XRE-family HTH domain